MVWNIWHKFFLSFTALLPSMVHRRSGHIVAISSVQGKIAIPYRSACKFPPINPSVFKCLIRTAKTFCTLWTDAASKHATQAYFDCLRAEVERCGIHVSVISPGYIRTNLSVNAVTGDGSKYGGEPRERHTSSHWWTFMSANIRCITSFHLPTFFFLLLSVLDKNTAQGRDPTEIARAVLKAVRQRNNDVILAGPLPSVAIYLRTLWPALFFKLMASRARKEQKPKAEWPAQQQSTITTAALKVEKAKLTLNRGDKKIECLLFIKLSVASWRIALWDKEKLI